MNENNKENWVDWVDETRVNVPVNTQYGSRQDIYGDLSERFMTRNKWIVFVSSILVVIAASGAILWYMHAKYTADLQQRSNEYWEYVDKKMNNVASQFENLRTEYKDYLDPYSQYGVDETVEKVLLLKECKKLLEEDVEVVNVYTAEKPKAYYEIETQIDADLNTFKEVLKTKVETSIDNYLYDKNAFDENGNVKEDEVTKTAQEYRDTIGKLCDELVTIAGMQQKTQLFSSTELTEFSQKIEDYTQKWKLLYAVAVKKEVSGELSESHNLDVETKLNELRTQLEESKTNEINLLNEQHELEVTALNEQHASEVSELQAQIESLQNQVRRLSR